MSPDFTCDFCQSCIHVRIHLPSEVDELLGVLYQPLPGSMYNPASKWTEAIIDDRQTALQILFPADHLHFPSNRLNRDASNNIPFPVETQQFCLHPSYNTNSYWGREKLN